MSNRREILLQSLNDTIARKKALFPIDYNDTDKKAKLNSLTLKEQIIRDLLADIRY